MNETEKDTQKKKVGRGPETERAKRLKACRYSERRDTENKDSRREKTARNREVL